MCNRKGNNKLSMAEGCSTKATTGVKLIMMLDGTYLIVKTTTNVFPICISTFIPAVYDGICIFTDTIPTLTYIHI